MGRVAQFRMPDLGEGLTEAGVLRWLVQVGETVRLNQPIVEVETAKAAVEVPSPYAGVVAELHAAPGQTVDVGAVLISVDTEPGSGPTGTARVAAEGAAANPVESAAPRQVGAVGDRAQVLADTVPAASAAPAAGPGGTLIGETSADGRTATLVGYGPRSGSAHRRPRRERSTPAAAPVPPPDVAVPPPATAARVSAAAVGQRAAVSAGGVHVLAKPPVRKLARDLGVDLATLLGSGPQGRVTREDVEQAARRVGTPPATVGAPVDGAAADGRGGDAEERIPVRGVRKLTAEAVVSSAFTAPHVTVFLTVDVTPTMHLWDQVAALPEFAGVRVTPLLFAARALLLAVRRTPEANSRWDEAAQEIVVSRRVHLGIAAATPRGLLVPKVRDADRLDLLSLARALQELAETARAGRTAPADLQGGTITITNVGSFGVDTGTPILNPGETAILCLGAVRPTPWVHEGEVAVRQVVQLALSFDHRVLDGQQGARVLADVGRILSEPAVAMAWS